MTRFELLYSCLTGRSALQRSSTRLVLSLSSIGNQNYLQLVLWPILVFFRIVMPKIFYSARYTFSRQSSQGSRGQVYLISTSRNTSTRFVIVKPSFSRSNTRYIRIGYPSEEASKKNLQFCSWWIRVEFDLPDESDWEVFVASTPWTAKVVLSPSLTWLKC